MIGLSLMYFREHVLVACMGPIGEMPGTARNDCKMIQKVTTDTLAVLGVVRAV
jgi:hypothetical protein